MTRGDYIAGGLALATAALVVSTRRLMSASTTTATGRSLPSVTSLLDAATGLLIEPPLRAAPFLAELFLPAERVSVAFLTGEEPGTSPEREAITREVDDAFARMNTYYRDVWYPQHFNFGSRRPGYLSLLTSRPDLPRTLANTSQYRSFAEQAAIVRSVLQSLGITQASSDTDVRRALLQSLTTRSIPGFSRHHWSTEIDAVSPDASAWQPGAPLEALIPFMRDEAPHFGFYNSYQDGAFPEPMRPHYNGEPWHLSYFPISSRLRERWPTEVDVPALLDRVAIALSPVASISTLRRVLPTLDLASYQRNVAPVPQTGLT